MKLRINIIFFWALLILMLSSCADKSLELAEKQYDSGEYDKAVDTIKNGKTTENMDEKYSLEAMSYLQMEDYEKAFETFTKAIDINSDVPEYYLNRAIAANKLGKNEEAEADFEEALERIEKLNNKDSKFLLVENYATFLFINEKYDKALEVLKKGDSLSLEDASFYDIRYNSLILLERYDEAVSNLDEGIKKYPDDANLNFMMAVNKLDSGDYQKSIEYLDKAKLAGKDDINYYKSIVYRLMGDYEKSLKSISEHLENKEEDAEAYLQKGIILNELGKYKRAIKSLEKALSIDLNFVEANYYIAISYEGLGEYEKSISYLNKVPKSSGVYNFAQEEIAFIKENLIKE